MQESRIVHFRDGFIREASERARIYELQDHGCADRVLAPFLELFGLDNDLLIKAASAITGGMGRRGKTCGVLIGGAMALGLKYGRIDPATGMEGLVEAQRAVYDLVGKFIAEFGTTSCRELTGHDFTDETQLQKFMTSGEFEEKCVEYAAKTAGWVAEIWSDGPKGW